MAKLQAPSGFRDFLPDQQQKRLELIRRIREVYESFGFQGMETPCMENLSVFEGKAGENEKLMYKVLKRGAELGRALEKKEELADLALRFDLTVPLARYFATHRAELPAVFKRYQIGPVWRAERAQRGRFREFVQCDVDVLGSDSMLVEAEVILATATAFSSLGFKDLTVRLNSRPLLNLLVQSFGVEAAQIGSAFIGIDKLDKETPEAVQKELVEKGVPESTAKGLLEFCVLAAKSDRAVLLEDVGRRVGAEGAKYLAQIREVLELTPALPSAKLVFDPVFARGMDYYTGPILEIVQEGAPGSLAGGGRFDELIEKLGGPKVPACGFSLGFERVFALMEERNMFPGASRAADVLVAVPDASAAKDAIALGAELRAAGLRADVFPGAVKLVKQYELAEKKGIPFAVVPGKDAVRDLSARQDTPVPRAEIATWLKARLAAK